MTEAVITTYLVNNGSEICCIWCEYSFCSYITLFFTLQSTIKSSRTTFGEKLSGLFSILEWQGPLIGASPSLL